MSKLLNKPLKAFTLYALLILGSSIPVYYLVVDFIWLDELDEQNQIIKDRIISSFNDAQIEENALASLLKNWNKLQANTILTPTQYLISKPDSSYTITKQNRYIEHDEIDRFRILSSYINLGGKPYHLEIETNIEEADETMLAIAFVTLLFFTFLVIGFILLNRRISNQIWYPFRNTLEKLKAFDLTSNQIIAFKISDIEEFEELNQSLQKLIDKNVSVYNQQKNFIENASHELQTPLAVLKSKLDTLLQNKDLTKEQSEIVNAIELPLSRMTRINKNLLLLAKIENNQFSDQENIELTQLVHETLEFLIDYKNSKRVIIDFKLSEKLNVISNKTLLEILINNLIINAIAHTIENGIVNIEVSSSKLTVSNTGLIPLDNLKIFERFVVATTGTASSGLGLAIVKEICNRYKWQIEYTFQDNMHVFTVKF